MSGSAVASAPRRRRGGRAGAVAFAALVALASAPAALAHAIPISSAPANGARVATAPAAVRVTFNGGVKVGAGTAAIDNDGTNVLGGTPYVTGPGAVELVVPLEPHLAPGTYTVRWSVVSDVDGHPGEGVIAFAVGSGSAAPVAALSAQGFVTWKSVTIRALFYLGVLAAAGAAFFAAVLLRPLGLDRTLLAPQSRLLAAAFLVALGGCAGLLATLSASGTDFSRAVDAATAAAAVGLGAAALSPALPALRYLAWTAAAVLLVCPTLGGHALDPTQPHVLAPLADVLHLGAAGVWFGGLASLTLSAALLAEPERARVVRRFSALALAAVVVLALTGLSRALTELSSLHEVWSTSYGRALIAKSALFLVLVGLGWRNRTFLLGAFARLRRSMVAELGLLCGVIVAVAVLTQLPPGREVTAGRPSAPAPVATLQPPLPAPTAFTEAQQAGPYAVGLAVAHGRARVTVIGADGTAPGGVAVTIDGGATTACGAGCFARAAGGRDVAVVVDHTALRFVLPTRLEPALALLHRATHVYTSLRDVAIYQVLSSKPGALQVTRYREQAPDRMTYVITSDSQPGVSGTAAVQIGKRRWDRAPGKEWVASVQALTRFPTTWWGSASRNAYLIRPNVIAFFDPSIPAWFQLTIDPSTDRPLRLGMIAAAHFMTERYAGFDKPTTIAPPP